MNKSIKTKKQVSKTLIKLLNYKPLDLITIKKQILVEQLFITTFIH